MVEYSYDAWGDCKIIKDTDNIATYNPYRYRGYYYDELKKPSYKPPGRGKRVRNKSKKETDIFFIGNGI